MVLVRPGQHLGDAEGCSVMDRTLGLPNVLSGHILSGVGQRVRHRPPKLAYFRMAGLFSFKRPVRRKAAWG